MLRSKLSVFVTIAGLMLPPVAMTGQNNQGARAFSIFM